MKTQIATLPDVFPYICVKGAAQAIEFYTRALGAEERRRLPVPTGELSHAELAIGGTVLMLADEYPQQGWLSPLSLPGTHASIVLAVEDSAAAVERAVSAGMKVEREMQEWPYGRGAWLVDPFGHRWCIMTPSA